MTGDNKYENGVIYRMYSEVDPKFYVGSTTESLKERLRKHKSAAGKHGDRPVYAHFNDIGWNHVKIEEIERFPCGSKTELNARERFIYDRLNPVLNTFRPHVTEEEARAKQRESVRKCGSRPWTCTMCNVTCSKGNKTHHLRSQKHLSKLFETNLVLTEVEETDNSDASSQCSTSDT
jgi:hypothetical protein